MSVPYVIFHEKGVYSHLFLKSDNNTDVLQEVYNMETDGEEEIEILQVVLPDKTNLLWNSTTAHYFFSKGRMTEEEFIKSCKFSLPDDSKFFRVIVEVDYSSENPEGIRWIDYVPKLQSWLPDDNKIWGFKFDSNLITLKLSAPSEEKAVEYVKNHVFDPKIVTEVDVIRVRCLDPNPVCEKGGAA